MDGGMLRLVVVALTVAAVVTVLLSLPPTPVFHGKPLSAAQRAVVRGELAR